tara:strand:- start:61 stop:969 length:909 start_codon:yes stop_codon:yes gene_type:complete
MAFINPFALVANGNSMTPSDVNTALEAAREYVDSGIIVPDIVNGSIETIDLYKTESYGFPIHGTLGSLQSVFSDSRGNGDRLSPVHVQSPYVVPWCHTWTGMPSPTRITIYPQLLQPYEKSIVPHMGRRVYLEANTLVQLFASWQYIVMSEMEQADPEGASSYLSQPVATYPQVATGSRAGSFTLAYKKVGDTSWTERPVTRRVIYPQEKVIDIVNWKDGAGAQPLSEFESWVDSGSYPDKAVGYMPVCHFENCDVFSVTQAGWYDIGLLYDKGVASPKVLQVCLGVRNLLIETFPGSGEGG